MRTRFAIYAAAALLLSACAGHQVQPPQDKLTNATQAVESARMSNAYQFASFDMANADRKLAQAQLLANSGNNKDRIQARRLAEEAIADARLAEAKSHLAQEQVAKTQMSQTVDALRKETQQNTGGAP